MLHDKCICIVASVRKTKRKPLLFPKSLVKTEYLENSSTYPESAYPKAAHKLTVDTHLPKITSITQVTLSPFCGRLGAILLPLRVYFRVDSGHTTGFRFGPLLERYHDGFE